MVKLPVGGNEMWLNVHYFSQDEDPALETAGLFKKKKKGGGQTGAAG